MVKVRNSIDISLLAGGVPAEWLERMQIEREAEAMIPIFDALILARDCKTENLELKITGIKQGLDMAGILAALNLDSDTLAAASLYGLLRDEIISLKLVRETLGPNIAKLLSGVKKMAAVRSLQNSASSKINETESS